jgi:hypothetical protein
MMTGRRRLASERGRLMAIGGFAAAVVLWLVPPVGADDNFPSVGAYAGKLTAQSSWADILKTPGIQVEFPMLNLGNAYVPLAALCVDAGMVRAADPRIGNGARLSAERVPGQVAAPPTTSGYAALHADALEGGDPFAVGPAALPEPRAQGKPDQPQHAPIEYLVTVYQVNSWFTSMRAPLFQKVWVIPTCRGS